MLSLLLAIAASSATAPSPAAAPARTSRCIVKSAGSREYRGPCRFIPEGNGSFMLEPVKRRFIQDNVSSVSVSIVAPGLAEVRGLTGDGVNSRWGEARRSPRDKACWAGSDFRICAY